MRQRIFIAILCVLLVLAAGMALAAAPDCSINPCGYLPLVTKPFPTPTRTATATATNTPQPTPTRTPIPPTATPTLPPPTYNNCQADPNPAAAPNYPVWIVTVIKDANPEIVRLRNTSTTSVNLDGWHMCSITGNQEHTGIGGTLAPGETRDYPYAGSGFIWNNTSRDDGALYTPDGRLVSYWVDPTP